MIKKNDLDFLRIALWLYKTQRNNKGPKTYLGLTILDWIVLCLLFCILNTTLYFFIEYSYKYFYILLNK